MKIFDILFTLIYQNIVIVYSVETFDPSIPTVFIVHGFTSSGYEESFQTMKHKFLSYVRVLNINNLANNF